eukprot:2822999-Alexandrium_andersonii.AAC.1
MRRKLWTDSICIVGLCRARSPSGARRGRPARGGGGGPHGTSTGGATGVTGTGIGVPIALAL